MTTASELLACDDDISKLLGGLLDSDVDVKCLESKNNPHEKACIAVYGNDDDKYQALCFCDLTLANILGAALAFVPQGYALECAQAGELPDNLRENFNEVMNLCTNLFRIRQSAGFSLKETHILAADLPGEVNSLLEDASAGRTDVEITIPRYGSGVLTLLSKGG